ncbi:hypothetical protein [Corynebacterium sp. p3-SID1194]|uniref:hypothetical protein n=1 Tax=Corynebacterium sp. p3-SID1194 TaxID=2916105 RepID=UPI0021A38D68|nr:hypothetical protein [Corynebacterium sp. p3-SID1194]MCT1450344.1 hypothetical protein [Corynebacterium sp. p3-SID1194]
MGQIESIDDLKSALKVDDLRKMSSDKVLDLVQMIQNDQISSGVLSALLTVAPDTVARLARAMDDSVQQVVTSNEKSSGDLYASIDFTKKLLAQIVQDPESSPEAIQDALDRLERYDNKLLEHDINNKRFNLEALRAHKEVLGAVLGFTSLVGVAAISPEARNTLIKNAPKALTTAAKYLLPKA